MDFRTYLDLILRSRPNDWLVVQHQDPDGHNEFLTFKNDLAISIAMGLPHLDDFQEAWVEVFPDKKASSAWVDLRWNGLPVLRVIGVNVDGARCMLPAADRAELTVPKTKSNLFELLRHPRTRGQAQTVDPVGVIPVTGTATRR
jgi:hypothetical protein